MGMKFLSVLARATVIYKTGRPWTTGRDGDIRHSTKNKSLRAQETCRVDKICVHCAHTHTHTDTQTAVVTHHQPSVAILHRRRSFVYLSLQLSCLYTCSGH